MFKQLHKQKQYFDEYAFKHSDHMWLSIPTAGKLNAT